MPSIVAQKSFESALISNTKTLHYDIVKLDLNMALYQSWKGCKHKRWSNVIPTNATWIKLFQKKDYLFLTLIYIIIYYVLFQKSIFILLPVNWNLNYNLFLFQYELDSVQVIWNLWNPRSIDHFISKKISNRFSCISANFSVLLLCLKRI